MKKIISHDPYDDDGHSLDLENYDFEDEFLPSKRDTDSYKFGYDPQDDHDRAIRFTEELGRMEQEEKKLFKQESNRLRDLIERARNERAQFDSKEEYEKFIYPQPSFNNPPAKVEIMPSSEEILREALEKAKEIIAGQDKVLKQLLDAPTARGYVVHTDNYKVLVSVPGAGLIEALFPYEAVHGKYISNLVKDGCMVRMQMEPVPAILDVIPFAGNTGDIVTVTKDGTNSECEIEYQGTVRIVRFGTAIKLPEVGDRLLVDGECNVAIRNLGIDINKFSFQGITGVTWDQIGGLQSAKDALQEAIELPILHPELYKRYNKKPIKGVLLYGPPGCGKTMLAKAAATSLSKLHGRKQADTGFIYVKGPELLNKFVGNTEAQVRSLFAQARKHHKKHGYPAVIFIDEADALLSTRGSREGLGIEGTVVPQFLAEMDGLDDSGAMVLLATNRPDSLDSAVTRDGRIDRKVQVTRPTQDEAVNIFKIYLKDKPLFEISVDEMAVLASECLYASELSLHKTGFALSNLANGAMIAGMVDKASTIALRREIAKQGVQGICKEDMLEAAISIFEQSRHLNHDEDFREFMESKKVSTNQSNLATI